MASHNAGKKGLASLVKVANEKGLVSDALKVDEDLKGGSIVPLPFEMSKWLNFKPWTSFDEWIRKSRQLVNDKLTSDKCLKGGSPGSSSSTSSPSSGCDGTFRHLSCVHISCAEVAMYKHQIHELIEEHSLKREEQFYAPTAFMLNAFKHLAHRVNSDLSYGYEQGGHLNTLRLTKPDFVMYEKAGNKERHKKGAKNSPQQKAVFSIEVKHPRVKLNQLEEMKKDGEKAPENNAKNVAISYNERFRKALMKRESGGDFEIDALHRALIQTNLYGLSVEKGLSVLWTHNEAVFLRAQPRVKAGKVTAIDVLTSKVYPCYPHGDEASTGEALLALMLFAPAAHVVKDFGSAILYLSNKIKEEKEGQDKREKKEERSSRDTQAKGSSSSAQKQEDKKKSQKNTKKRQAPFIDRFMSQLIIENLEGLPNRFESMSNEEQGKLLRSLRRDEFLSLNLVEMETMFVQHYDELIAVGTSGKVILAEIGGLPVAIKKWNVNSDWGFFEDGTEALAALQNEVHIHKRLARELPELLGDIVPRLYAVLEEPENETTLVTEYVGDKLLRHCLNEGTLDEGPFEWYVNGELLTEKDQMQINEAATKGIWELAKREIWHRDYREDNLRVKRIIDEDGEPNWRAWWIDFGLARIREGRRLKPFEWKLGSPSAL